MIASIGTLHVVGWFVLLAVVVPQHLSIGTKAFGIGIGITAYMLGMRHAFDADHIAAIDNMTRRLMQDGRRPLSVGFWFSLGHSSVVLALTLLLSFGIRGVIEPVLDDTSVLHSIAGLTGTIVSSGFLYVIAALNLLVLIEIWRVSRQIRAGRYDGASLQSPHAAGGIMSRLLRPVMACVSRPWQMYFVGLLFGLGFDTATEVALLVLTGSGSASGLPWYAILCLPILFGAGMSLLDSIDGYFMSFAYGWALDRPERKIYYNLIVTGLSIVVAVTIGTVDIVTLASEKLKLSGAFWNWLANVDLNRMGFIIVGLFLTLWIIAISIRKHGRLGEQLSPSENR